MMAVSGLYFLPLSSTTSSFSLLDAIVERFQAAYQDATFTGRWSLEHRLLRDTPSAFSMKSVAPKGGQATQGEPREPRHVHFLTMSSYPSRSFIYASSLPKHEREEADAAAIAAVTQLLTRPPGQPAPKAPTPTTASAEKQKEETPPVPVEAHPDDEQQLLQQQEMLFKQHLAKHKEQQEQQLRMQREEEERKAKEAEQKQLEEQQKLLFQQAGSAPEQSQHLQQQQAKKEEEEKAKDDDGSRMIMITADKASFHTWYNITLRAAQPLWVPRHTVMVSATNSSVFEIANFRIRIGEVRQTAPVTRVRGVIVEVGYDATGWRASQATDSSLTLYYDEELERSNNIRLPTENDWEVGEMLIREFWGRFSVPGAKEYIRVAGVGTEANAAWRERRRSMTAASDVLPGLRHKAATNDDIEGIDLARQYMEAFRFSR